MLYLRSWILLSLVLCIFLSSSFGAKGSGRRNRSTTPSTATSTIAAAEPISATTPTPVIPTTVKVGPSVQRNRSKSGGRRSKSKSAERVRRQIGSPYGLGGGIGMGGYGGGYGLPLNSAATGSAIGTANALMGQATSNGQTFTNPMGYSSSNANGFASGYSPSSTSIANSNSQGGFMGRRKRYVQSVLPFFTV